MCLSVSSFECLNPGGSCGVAAAPANFWTPSVACDDDPVTVGDAPSVIDAADALVDPIRLLSGTYSHLRVRAACAIALDRLLGPRTAAH